MCVIPHWHPTKGFAMTGQHPPFSLLDSEVHGWLLDESFPVTACGMPLLTCYFPLCRGGTGLIHHQSAARGNHGSHPFPAEVQRLDSTRGDYIDSLLSAATPSPRPLCGLGNVIPAPRRSHVTPVGKPHSVCAQDTFCNLLLSPWAAVRPCPLGLGRNSLSDTAMGLCTNTSG